MKTIVCLGDSITWGFDANYGFKDIHQVEIPYPLQLQTNLGMKYHVVNSGNSGWQARTTIKHLDELVFAHHPDTVILMLGINDARGSRQGLPVTVKGYFETMKQIILKIQSQGINVILMGPTPVFHFRVKFFNQSLKKLANQLNLKFIDSQLLIGQQLESDGLTLGDILKDRVHLSQEYYIKLGDIVYKQIKDNI